MKDTSSLSIGTGFSDAERNTIAELYWQAFAPKLGIPLGPENRAMRFISSVLNPDFALVARDKQGQILGVAGFKTNKGSMVGGGLRDLAAIYGWVGTVWRLPILALLERNLEPDILLMDGIFVSEQARGKGVGTALLDAIKTEAVRQKCNQVRLDVINTNPRAKALYLRQNFKESGVETLGLMRHLFGFDSATRMIWHSDNR